MSTDDTRLDDLLRSLDAADPELDDPARRRAHALLDRILADDAVSPGDPADPAPPAPVGSADGGFRMPGDAAPTPLAPRRNRRVRWLAIPAAAAAFALVASLWPGFGSRGEAYASWTPTPVPVTGELRDRTTQACVQQLIDAERRHPEGEPHAPVSGADTARIQIAEQRGDYIFVALSTDVGADWTCLFEARHPGQPIAAGGGMPTVDMPPPAPLRPEELRATGTGASGGPEGSFADAMGRVGSEVRAVTVHSQGKVIEASVNEGVFAAWWPIDDVVMPVNDITFDVTLADGRVLTGVDDGMSAPMPGPREVGRISLGAGSDDKAMIDGLAGSDVAAVTVHLPDDRALDTTLEGRQFHVAWDLPRGSYDPGIEPADLRFTLILTDGTVLPHTRALTR